ncbi:hypothetical protein IEQ34_011115 [Dendrobium chrysotoxum]|uniref:Uncharacterized protein n=1 Tax=Dendrobium chrysotoxum TaxID=161865 RepID=A0AAV7GVF0_DENCH|nr:hypothetical protein IEQ34_011115 [Dendrobium chrysotoxum]
MDSPERYGRVESEEDQTLHRGEKSRVFTSFGMKKYYVCLERINRRLVNILDGLELHTEHTYSEPKKWIRGK